MKSSEVIISVIVPVYNAEKYLKRCVDSILSQSFSDFELLLIDDGSSDLSGLFCDEYAIADKRVSAFHTEIIMELVGLDNMVLILQKENIFSL